MLLLVYFLSDGLTSAGLSEVDCITIKFKMHKGSHNYTTKYKENQYWN